MEDLQLDLLNLAEQTLLVQRCFDDCKIEQKHLKNSAKYETRDDMLARLKNVVQKLKNQTENIDKMPNISDDPYYSDISSPEGSTADENDAEPKIIPFETNPPLLNVNNQDLKEIIERIRASPKCAPVRRVKSYAGPLAISSPSAKLTKRIACTICYRLISSQYMNYHMRVKHRLIYDAGLQGNLLQSALSQGCTNLGKLTLHSAPVTPSLINLVPGSSENSSSRFLPADNFTSSSYDFQTTSTSSDFLTDVTSAKPETIKDIVNAALMTKGPKIGGVVRLTCPLCMKQFKKTEYLRHIRFEHASSSPRRILWKDQYKKCKLCKKVYRCPEFNRHIRIVHKSIGCRYKCSVCYAGFQSQRACKLHMTRLNHRSDIIVKSELMTEDYGEQHQVVVTDARNDDQCDQTQNIVNVEIIKTEFD